MKRFQTLFRIKMEYVKSEPKSMDPKNDVFYITIPLTGNQKWVARITNDLDTFLECEAYPYPSEVRKVIEHFEISLDEYFRLSHEQKVTFQFDHNINILTVGVYLDN